TFDQLQYEGVHALAVLEPVDRRNGWMVQRRKNLRFALEAREPIGIGRERLGQHLQGDVTIEPGIPRTIHLAHAAGADGTQNLVRTELRADVHRLTGAIRRSSSKKLKTKTTLSCFASTPASCGIDSAKRFPSGCRSKLLVGPVL